jgi:hypothetical protein
VCEIKHELRTLGLHVILIFLHVLVIESLSCGLAQNFPGFVRWNRKLMMALHGLSISRRTITPRAEVEVVRGDHIGQDGLGPARARGSVFVDDVADSRRRVQNDHSLIHDLEGVNITIFLRCKQNSVNLRMKRN